jgi:ribonucleoside-triphosphate reductase
VELEVNLETAIDQLERYKMLMESWCDQNVSATISYGVDEVPAIVDWLLDNWSTYVGVSFLFRADPTKTAKDLGYLYLPQEVVTKSVYDQYVANLQPIDLNSTAQDLDLELVDECAGGACPIR